MPAAAGTRHYHSIPRDMTCHVYTTVLNVFIVSATLRPIMWCLARPIRLMLSQQFSCAPCAEPYLREARIGSNSDSARPCKGGGGEIGALARCSIVDYDGMILYDEYVRPSGQIIDYRTRFSGIRPSHMTDAVPYADARLEILGILNDKYIVGHDLVKDLQVLDYTPPPQLRLDTSLCIHLRVLAFGSYGDIDRKPSLKRLAST
eukprot:sb/3470531/